MPLIDDAEAPEGVDLWDPDDSDGLRGRIETNFQKSLDRYVNGTEFGGVRLQLKDMSYVDKEKFSLREQRDAKDKDRMLARRLRGTVELVDNVTNEVLDTRKNITLARVPYLTQRGTFINNGSEYAPISQSRLMPGAYARRRDNGEVECFHSQTEIWTEHGVMSIGEIVNKRMAVRVWSYDFETSKFVLKPVVAWHRNQVRDRICRVKFNGDGLWPSVKSRNRDTLWVTPTHKIFEKDGTKRAVEDTIGGALVVEERFSDTQEQVILGSLLGDGYIDSRGIFQEGHCNAQRPYLEWKKSALGDMVACDVGERPMSSESFGTAETACYIHTKSFACLRDLRSQAYPEDVKTVTSSWLDRVEALGLAVWFMDDGHCRLAKNSKTGKTACFMLELSTLGFSGTDVDLLKSWLGTKWGVAMSKIQHRDKRSSVAEQWKLQCSGGAAEKFLSIVAPYMHDSMAYKLGERPPTGACDTCGQEQACARKVCNRCWLQRAELLTPDQDTSGLRKRFGSMRTVRSILTGQLELPKDENPVARWDARESSRGSQLDYVAASASTVRVLRRVDYSFDRADGSVFGRVKEAYDIEVEDTHNYFAHGVLVSNCHMNTRPGTGSAMRLSMHPETAEYRIRVGGADLHAYSFFHEMGVPDEELLRRWGPEVLEKNKAKFSKDVLDRAYNKMSPKWERDPALPREAKIAAITAALNRAQLAKDILRRNLGNLYSEKQASYLRTMRVAYDRIEDMQKQASQPFSPDLSYEQTLVSSQELDFDNWMAFGKSAAEFAPDFAPLELREEYNAKGGVGPRLAAAQDWPKKWLDDQDNQGWLQWFERYSDGRKSDHDEKQIARWLSFKRRQGAQFAAKPTPRRAFALRNWAIDPLKLLPQDHRAPFEEEMKRYKQQEFVKWYMRRHDFDDMAKHRLALKAQARGAPVAPELSAGDLISLAAEGYIQPKDLV